jgi:hypothetical protein
VGGNHCQLQYNLNGVVASGDELRTFVSSTGSTWTQVASWSGSPGWWQTATYPLAGFDNRASVYIRFELVTDSSSTGDGVSIDNVKLNCLRDVGTYQNNEYAFSQGTSFGAAYISGAAALLKAYEPAATVADLKKAILNGVDPQSSLSGTTVSGGRLNVQRSLALADTTPPPVPLISSPPNNSYDTDGIITLSGTAEKGSTVELFEEATSRGTTTASSAIGAWSKALSGVTNGRHSYTATATDQAGNTSAASAARTIIVDSVKPKGTLSINNGAATTKSRTVTLYTRASDPAPASGVAYMRFRNYPSTTWTGWFPYALRKSWILTGGKGTKTVYVQYKDRAGNTSAPTYDKIKYAP